MGVRLPIPEEEGLEGRARKTRKEGLDTYVLYLLPVLNPKSYDGVLYCIVD